MLCLVQKPPLWTLKQTRKSHSCFTAFNTVHQKEICVFMCLTADVALTESVFIPTVTYSLSSGPAAALTCPPAVSFGQWRGSSTDGD